MRPDTKLVRLERSRDSRIRNHWISPEARSSLVEDNELNREIALELLGGFGMELEAAVNGGRPLNVLRRAGQGIIL